MSPMMLLAIAAAVVFLVVARQRKQREKTGVTQPSVLTDLMGPKPLSAGSDLLKTKLRELAGELERVQFDPVASLLEAVADNDEATAVLLCKQIRAAVRNPSSLLQLFKPTTDFLLKTMLEDNETRSKIVKLLKTTPAK